MNLKERFNELKTNIPALVIALKSPETPWCAKFFAALTVAYALSPIDLIPDFIPILGYLDDIIILPLLAAITIKLIPKELFQQYKNQASELSGKQQKWYYALPIIVFWIVVIALIFKAVF